MGEAGAGPRRGRGARRRERVVDRGAGVPSSRGKAARRGSGGEARGNRDARAGPGSEGIRGIGAARVAARAWRRTLLSRGPGGSRGRERARRSARGREAPVHQRCAGRDGTGGRADAVAAVGRRGGEERRPAESADRSRLGGGLVIRVDVVTLFPETFAAVTGSGITSRALQAGLWRLATWNPRDFTSDSYRTVDDRPYGGGPGMVMLAEPLDRVPEELLSGHDENIRRWRLKQALGRTWLRRPDLLAARPLSEEETKLLAEFQREYRS